MSQFVFVLTVNHFGSSSPYVAGLRLAAMSVRHFHPDVPIVCLGDESAAAIFADRSSSLTQVIDRFILCPDASGGATHRSRVIKTSLRRRLDGPFVYLDTDTILVSDVSPLLACALPLGFVADAWFSDAVGRFPGWCEPVYRELGWTYPTDRYFNSGAFFCDASPVAHDFFDDWQRRFLQCVAIGICLDQPGLNAAVHERRIAVQEYSEDFNFFCANTPRLMPSSARLLHVCCSLPKTIVPVYQRALTTLQNGGPVNVAEVIDDLRGSGIQQLRPLHRLRDVARRVGERTFRFLCRANLMSARDF